MPMLKACYRSELTTATVEMTVGGMSGKCFDLVLRVRTNEPMPKLLKDRTYGLTPGPFDGRAELECFIAGKIPTAVFADWCEEVELGDADLWQVLRNNQLGN